MGVFARMLLDLAARGQQSETVMVDSTHLKAHRTAASLCGKRGALATRATASLGAPKAG